MPTALDVAEHVALVTDATTLAVADLFAQLEGLDQANPDLVRDALLDVTGPTITPYADTIGELSATWYEDLRDRSDARGLFDPVVPNELDDARVEEAVRWAVGPLYGQSDSTVLTLLAGSVQKLLADVGRATVFSNGALDRSPVGYQRVPAPGCCAFCAMLASRTSDLYRSKEAAERVVGRGTPIPDGPRRRGGQARGVRPRGPRALGEQYHDFCNCVGTPVFPGDPVTFDPGVIDVMDAYFTASQQVHGPRDEVWSQWYAARRAGEAWTDAPEFDISAKRILAEMRRLTGAR